MTRLASDRKETLERALEQAPLGLDEHEPQVEPEFVWCNSDLTVFNVPDDVDEFDSVFESELGVINATRRDRDNGFEMVGDETPVKVPLATARMAAHADGVALVLFDDDGNEIRRWVL